jgi:two-component system chemotaxis sensor kinase CheA
MPALDAALFLDAVPDDLPLVATDPDETALREGEFEGGFDLYVGSAADPETLAATLGGLWACEGATVTDLGAAPTSAAGDETEVAGDVTGSDASTDATDASDDAGDAGDAPTTDAETPPTRQPKSGPSTEVRAIRVDVDQLDGLYELVEQLVTTRIKLRRALDADRRRGALEQLNELEKTSANLQNSVMRMRLIPLSKVFDKFPRLVRDLSRAQDKRVEFRVEGGDVELDRTILDALGDPVMHLLRNAVDHGIETPAEREAAGKPPAGSVELRATRENDRVLITLRDDGKGLDPERIRQKAVERGLVTAEEAALLPDERVFDFVFEAGFSTAEQVTDVSGRGVGMDAVRTAVAALDGSVALASTPGEGTLVTVRLPVSVAIVKVLLVRVGDAEYGVPVDQVAEIRQCKGLDTIRGREVYSRGETLEPVVRLRDVLAAPGEPTDEGMLVRISPEERAVVLHCDAVLQQEEVVVKPFRGALEGVPGMGGAAVVGEGDIVPILDVATLPLVGGVALPDEADLERAVTEEVTA